MAFSGGFNNPYDLTVAKTSPSKGPTKSLRQFTKGIREKLNKNPIVDFRTDSHFQDVMQSCNDIKEVYLSVDEGLQSLIEMLKKMKRANAKTISTISGRVQYLTDNSHHIIQKGNKNYELVAKLDSAADYSSGASYIDEIEDNFEDMQVYEKAIRCALQQYEEGKGLIARDFMKTKIWLRNLEEVIEGRRDENSPVNITMDELKVLCGCLGKNVQESKIFVVVNTEEGKQRVAQVEIISNNQINMRHFEEMELPPKSFFIEFESVTSCTSRWAYLDLSFKGTFLNRIVISLQEEGYLPLYFLHMCTGDLEHFEVSPTGNLIIRQSVADVKEMTNRSEFCGVDWRKEMERDKYSNGAFKEGNVQCQALNKTAAVFQIVTQKRLGVNLPKVGNVTSGFDKLKESLSRYPSLMKGLIKGDVTDCRFIITF